MAQTSVSSKYQVVIPKEVREKMDVKPGQKLIILEDGGVIHLIPQMSVKKLRGIFKERGLSLENLRDKSNRSL